MKLDLYQIDAFTNKIFGGNPACVVPLKEWLPDAMLLQIAKENQAANMFLEVRQSNLSAIALYENIGFNEMAIRRAYYPAANGREDAVLMGLAL